MPAATKQIRIAHETIVTASSTPSATYCWGVTFNAAVLAPQTWFKTRAQAEQFLRYCNCDLLRCAIARLGA